MKRRRSKLTDEQSMRLMEHFVAGTPARTAAELVGVNRNTARLFYHRVRELIAQHLAEDSPFKGRVGVDESCLEPSAESHKPSGKLPVFALVKRGGKVYTAMVLDSRGDASPPKATVRPDSVVYTDPPAAPSGTLDVSRFQHRRIVQPAPDTPDRPIDSVENFWNQAKRHMRRYNGIPRRHFHLFLKEQEWRFNYGSPKELLTKLTHWIRHPE